MHSVWKYTPQKRSQIRNGKRIFVSENLEIRCWIMIKKVQRCMWLKRGADNSCLNKHYPFIVMSVVGGIMWYSENYTDICTYTLIIVVLTCKFIITFIVEFLWFYLALCIYITLSNVFIIIVCCCMDWEPNGKKNVSEIIQCLRIEFCCVKMTYQCTAPMVRVYIFLNSYWFSVSATNCSIIRFVYSLILSLPSVVLYWEGATQYNTM